MTHEDTPLGKLACSTMEAIDELATGVGRNADWLSAKEFGEEINCMHDDKTKERTVNAILSALGCWAFMSRQQKPAFVACQIIHNGEFGKVGRKLYRMCHAAAVVQCKAIAAANAVQAAA